MCAPTQMSRESEILTYWFIRTLFSRMPLSGEWFSDNLKIVLVYDVAHTIGCWRLHQHAMILQDTDQFPQVSEVFVGRILEPRYSFIRLSIERRFRRRKSARFLQV